MAEAWPDLAGRLVAGVHVLPVRVYFEDTDAGGVVYHARYLAFCERARSDMLRLMGIHQSRMGELGFVVRRMACEFLKPARLDDLLEVETRFREWSGARLEMNQSVRRGAEVLFQADVTIAVIDLRGRPRRLPAKLAALFSGVTES